MKIFIYGLYIFFGSLLVLTVVSAINHNSGMVIDNYYEKAKNYTKTFEQEQKLGLWITKPKNLKVGKSKFITEITAKDKPLSAKATLFIGNSKTQNYDKTYTLKELSGVYSADIDIPKKGIWLFRVELDSDIINTEKKWFIEVN